MRTGALFIFLACATLLHGTRPKAGMYRGLLLLDRANNTELPFTFQIELRGKRPVITIYNADERIVITDVVVRKDSLHFKMPVFDTEFRTRMVEGGLSGLWINHYRTNERILKFRAIYGESRRFTTVASTGNNIQGRWEATFSPGTVNESKAVGIFHHVEQTPDLSGTFLTETGDYRYLSGQLHEDSLMLSAFDGSHAFLFRALVRGDSIVKGMFYSGAHWQEPWSARKNPGAALRDPNKLTSVVDSAKVQFAFPNLKSRTVSLNDKRYLNRPVIVQIMGSWCPNCMDESRYLNELYKSHRSDGLEIIALAFEKTADKKLARRRLARMKEQLDIDYEVLITGAVGKDEATRTLPQLSGIMAFPTTLFLNREHRIVRVHTGFSGPATGQAFKEFQQECEALIKKLTN